MVLNFDSDNKLIPKFNKNQELPEQEQVKFYWRYPTYSERKLIKYWTDPSLRNPDIFLKLDFGKAVELCVTKIDNLEVGGKKINTGKELISLNGPVSFLIEEVGSVICNKMDEVITESKN